MLALSQFTVAQDWQWVRGEGGDRYGGAMRVNEGTGICTDNHGHVYAIGSFGGKAAFGKDTLNGYYMDPVLIKYDTSGKLLWAKQLATGATDFAHGICLDQNQNVIVSGDKSGSAIRTFVAKYDPTGKLLWEHNVKGEGCHTSARAVVSDRSGNIYVAGDCKGKILFDSLQVGDSNKYTIFLAKYSAEGKILWVKNSQPHESYYNQARGMTIDKNDNIYVTGEFFASAKFGAVQVVSRGESDAFIAEYNTAGKLQWIRQYGSKSKDSPESIAIDIKGDVYLTAYFTDTCTANGKKLVGDNLIKLNAKGDIIWSTHIGVGEKDFYLRSFVAVDSKGYSYLTGYYYRSMVLLGEKVAAPGGSANIYIAKCRPDGRKIWLTTLGNAGVDEGKAICVDNDANIYVTGYYHLNTNFGNKILLLSPQSNDDGMFVGKLK